MRCHHQSGDCASSQNCAKGNRWRPGAPGACDRLITHAMTRGVHTGITQPRCGVGSWRYAGLVVSMTGKAIQFSSLREWQSIAVD